MEPYIGNGRVISMNNIFTWPFRKDTHSEFEQLLRPQLTQMYRLAFRLTGTREDAGDLVQDVLLKLFPRLDELRDIEKLGPWIARVLYRQFVDLYRRQQRSPINLSEDDHSLYNTHASLNDGPDDSTNSSLIQTQLQKALDQLNEDQRLLIFLHDVEGYSLQEINRMQDIAIGTIKSRLSRARSKMKQILHHRFQDNSLSISKYREPSKRSSVLTDNR